MDGQNFNNQPPVYQQPTEGKPNGLSIASLVLGILGIVIGCCSGLIGLIISGVGVVLGVMGYTKSKTKLGLAGLIVSIVGCVLSVVSWIIGFAMLNALDLY